jgi:hypothetical protein
VQNQIQEKKRRYGVYPTENEEKEGREYKWEIERD